MFPQTQKDIELVPRWYTLATKSRHEKVVKDALDLKGYEVFLPLRTVIKKWSDRKKRLQEPLFKGYLFVNMPYKRRIPVLETEGVVRIVMFNGRPGVLHESEVRTIQKILDMNHHHGVTIEAIEGMVLGDNVEVIDGPLTGIQGQYAAIKNENRLVISIDSIGKSLAVEVPLDSVRKVIGK
jgi:transcription antitermination factor NusG